MSTPTPTPITLEALRDFLAAAAPEPISVEIKPLGDSGDAAVVRHVMYRARMLAIDLSLYGVLMASGQAILTVNYRMGEAEFPCPPVVVRRLDEHALFQLRFAMRGAFTPIAMMVSRLMSDLLTQVSGASITYPDPRNDTPPAAPDPNCSSFGSDP